MKTAIFYIGRQRKVLSCYGPDIYPTLLLTCLWCCNAFSTQIKLTSMKILFSYSLTKQIKRISPRVFALFFTR